MQLYDDATVAASDPGVPAAGASPGYLTDGVPGQSPASIIRAWWLNGIAKELLAVITGAGLTPARSVFTQLYQAITLLITAAVAPMLSKAAAALLYQPIGDYQPAGQYQGAGFYLSGQTIAYLAAGTSQFVPGAGVTAIYVEVLGGGGGGAGGGTGKSGGGGGAGGYSAGRVPVTPGQTYTLTVGAPGASGAAASDGGAGGDSDFAGVLHATGGKGGIYNASTAGGPPGTGCGSAAMIALAGGDGTDGNPSGISFAGSGGASQQGGGGRGGSGGGVGGRAPGSGGGGSYNGGGAGGLGAAGAVIIRF